MSITEWSLTITNDSGADLLIEDIGLFMSTGEALVLDAQMAYGAITNSDDLRQLVSDGDVSINDGVGDLSAADAVEYLIRVNIYWLRDNFYDKTEIDTALDLKSDATHLHDDRYYTETEIDTILGSYSDVSHIHDDRYYTETEIDTALDLKSDATHLHDDRYYTQTELSTSGQAVVDWGNVTNVPTLGSPHWLDAVEARVAGIGLAVAPAAPAAFTDDPWFYVDDSNDLLKWDGVSAWAVVATLTAGARVIDIADVTSPDEEIYDFDGTTWVADTDPALVDNASVTVEDSGESSSKSIYAYSLNADNTTYHWVKIADITLDPHLVRGDHVLKHDADQIEVHSSFTNFDTSGDNDLETTLLAIDVAISAQGGQLDNLTVINGVVYGKDTSRGKWLGPRESYIFSRSGKYKKAYLAMAGGLISNNSGIRADRAMTLTSASVQFDATHVGTATIYIKDSGGTNIATLVVTNDQGVEDTSFNVDIAAQETLHVYMEADSVVEDPTVKLTVAFNGGAL